jgi:DUF1680 family protein
MTPFATIEPVHYADVTLIDDFWSPRVETLRETTIEYVYDRLVESGRIENFRIAAGEREGEFNGIVFNDSDVYKWLEGASYLLADAPDPDLADRVSDVVDAVAAAQEADGYLNTYFTIAEPGKRWTNLHRMHELYCAGHLFEAAVAHHEATGERRLLEVARAFADHVDERFGPDADPRVPGHEEVEIGLVRLYRATGEERYLDLAAHFVEARGRDGSRLEVEFDSPEGRAGEPLDLFLDDDGTYDGRYAQDHRPLREQATVEGHAVRAMYLFTAATEIVKETGDRELFDALERLQANLTGRRMYVTGGIGSRADNEGFSGDYDLPNRTSYAETCAAIGSVFWHRRLFELTGDATYLDVLERTLYNGFLAGVSLDGTRFSYDNPLEVSAAGDRSAERDGWFGTACCPTNVPRLLASISGYVYARDPAVDRLFVNLHVGSEASTAVAGESVELAQETDHPWQPRTRLTVSPSSATEFELALRVPEWCENPSVTVNGEDVPIDPDDGFVRVARTWTDGDELVFDADFPVRVLRAHPAVEADAGRVALQRGPVVYCVESVDHDRPLHQLALRPEGTYRPRHDPDLLDGVTVLEGPVLVPDLDDWEDELYQDDRTLSETETPVRAIPYYGWGHRGAEAMRVWNCSAGR